MPKLVHRERVPKETAQKIIAFIRRGNPIGTAAGAAGIHRDTFYDWMKRGERGEAGYKEFADQVNLAKDQAAVAIFEVVRTSMGQPVGKGAKVWQSAAWWLERMRAQDFALKQKTEITGPGGGPLQVLDVANMSDEDLRRVSDGSYVPPGATVQ